MPGQTGSPRTTNGKEEEEEVLPHRRLHTGSAAVEGQNTSSLLDAAQASPRSPEAEEIVAPDATDLSAQLQWMKEFQGKATVQNLDPPGNLIQEVTGKIVGWRYFEAISCFLIVADAALIGVEADLKVNFPGVHQPEVRVFNFIFMSCFTVELLLRVAREGARYYHLANESVNWNYFDTVLVVSSIIENILSSLMSGAPDMSQLRLFRIMRIIRGLRIIRVLKAFKDLRIMIAGLLLSMQSLLWAAFLLCLLMYMFAVSVLQFAADQLAASASSSQVLTAAQEAAIMERYGGVGKAMLTLFMSITGGLDWIDAYTPLEPIGPLVCMLYLIYVFLSLLCVLNIITGIFVENATKITTRDDEMVMMEQLQERNKWFDDVKELFKAADTDGTGTLNADEFAVKMQDFRMQAWLRKIGVHVETYSAHGLFALLDFDGDGILGLEEFAHALQSVHGNARSVDLARVSKDCRAIRKELNEFLQLSMEIFRTIAPDLVQSQESVMKVDKRSSISVKNAPKTYKA